MWFQENVGTKRCPQVGTRPDHQVPPAHQAPSRHKIVFVELAQVRLQRAIFSCQHSYLTHRSEDEYYDYICQACARACRRHHLFRTKFTGFGQCHASAVRALQEVAVGGLVALNWRGPVVVGVLRVPRVRPPLQLIP